jgi:hypothetical protein
MAASLCCDDIEDRPRSLPQQSRARGQLIRRPTWQLSDATRCGPSMTKTSATTKRFLPGEWMLAGPNLQICGARYAFWFHATAQMALIAFGLTAINSTTRQSR